MNPIDRTRAKNGLPRGSRAILRIVRIAGKRVDMKPFRPVSCWAFSYSSSSSISRFEDEDEDDDDEDERLAP
jgi:hypothetical protein